MARGRLISRTLGSSRKFAELHREAGKLAEFAQALYPLLVACSDDFGRLSGDAFTVKHAVFPTSPRREADFATVLNAMRRAGLIEWYAAGDQQVIEIVEFKPHQPGLHKRTESKFPGNSGKFPAIPSKEKRREEKGTEGNEEYAALTDSATPSAALELRSVRADDGEMLLLFPTQGHPNAWALTREQVAVWQQLYPGLDVMDECRHAFAWVQASPAQKKTASGMPRFLTRWFTRSVERRGGVNGQAPSLLGVKSKLTQALEKASDW